MIVLKCRNQYTGKVYFVLSTIINRQIWCTDKVFTFLNFNLKWCTVTWFRDTMASEDCRNGQRQIWSTFFWSTGTFRGPKFGIWTSQIKMKTSIFGIWLRLLLPRFIYYLCLSFKLKKSLQILWNFCKFSIFSTKRMPCVRILRFDFSWNNPVTGANRMASLSLTLCYS